jgi:hypothetical protein
MPVVHIALEEGFVNDRVSVAIDGKEVFQADDVKTRTQIGLARTFEVDVPAGRVRVQISLPSKNVAQSIDLDVSEKLYLALSVTAQGGIEHRVSSEPFGYA